MARFFSSNNAQALAYGAATIGMGCLTLALGVITTALAMTILGLPAAIFFSAPLTAACANTTSEFANAINLECGFMQLLQRF